MWVALARTGHPVGSAAADSVALQRLWADLRPLERGSADILLVKLSSDLS